MHECNILMKIRSKNFEYIFIEIGKSFNLEVGALQVGQAIDFDFTLCSIKSIRHSIDEGKHNIWIYVEQNDNWYGGHESKKAIDSIFKYYKELSDIGWYMNDYYCTNEYLSKLMESFK